MLVKTSDLIGPALDWAVASIEGVDYVPHYLSISEIRQGNCTHRSLSNYRPSTDWSQGGPLIERYKLDIGAPMEKSSGPWNANTEWGHPLGQKGDTPLIAACRAIVAAKLGDQVDVPDELIQS